VIYITFISPVSLFPSWLANRLDTTVSPSFSLSLSLACQTIGCHQCKPIRARRVLSAAVPSHYAICPKPSRGAANCGGGEVGRSRILRGYLEDSRLLTAMASCCRVDVKHAEAEPWFGFPSSYGNAEVMMMVPVLRVKAFWPNFATRQQGMIPGAGAFILCSSNRRLTGGCRTHER
jgi:hypothetical protein